MTYDDVAEIKAMLDRITELLELMLPLLVTTANRLTDIEQDTTVMARCVSDNLPMIPTPDEPP